MHTQHNGSFKRETFKSEPIPQACRLDRGSGLCITPNGAWSVPPSGKTNQFILICKSAKCQRAYWVNSQNLITAPGPSPAHPSPPHPTMPVGQCMVHMHTRPVHGSHTVGQCMPGSHWVETQVPHCPVSLTIIYFMMVAITKVFHLVILS